MVPLWELEALAMVVGIAKKVGDGPEVLGNETSVVELVEGRVDVVDEVELVVVVAGITLSITVALKVPPPQRMPTV
jgi:hypothetical protein